MMSELLRIYQFRDRKRICCYDLSVTQCYALNALIRCGSMTMKELAQELYLDKSTASRVVDSIERKGYAKRKTQKQDKRVLNLEVTAKGKQLYARIEEDLVAEMKKMLKDFDPAVRSAAIDLVKALTQAAKDRFSGKWGECCQE